MGPVRSPRLPRALPSREREVSPGAVGRSSRATPHRPPPATYQVDDVAARAFFTAAGSSSCWSKRSGPTCTEGCAVVPLQAEAKCGGCADDIAAAASPLLLALVLRSTVHTSSWACLEALGHALVMMHTHPMCSGEPHNRHWYMYGLDRHPCIPGGIWASLGVNWHCFREVSSPSASFRRRHPLPCGGSPDCQPSQHSRLHQHTQGLSMRGYRNAGR